MPRTSPRGRMRNPGDRRPRASRNSVPLAAEPLEPRRLLAVVGLRLPVPHPVSLAAAVTTSRRADTYAPASSPGASRPPHTFAPPRPLTPAKGPARDKPGTAAAVATTAASDTADGLAGLVPLPPAPVASRPDEPPSQGPVPALSAASWTPLGPAPLSNGQTPGSQPVSGRVAAVAAHPTDPNTLYLAAAGGGVWKTTNGGTSWTPLTDTQSTLFMGAIAVSTSNPSVIYAGTGESSNSFLSYYGRGVLKSTDAGATWTLLGAAPFDRKTISQIAIDPTDPNIAYVAVAGGGVNGVGGGTGIWKTVNGGTTWTNTTASITTSAAYSDVVIDPGAPQTLYAAIGSTGGGATNGVYKSINGGASWSRLGNGIDFGNVVGITRIAISRSDTRTLYVAITGTGASGSSSFGSLYKMMKTTDGGDSWSVLPNTPNYQGGQGWYDSNLAVDPANPNVVYASGAAGANSVIRTLDGGGTWSDITQGAIGTGPHVDHHAIGFDASGRLLDGDDGGLWRLDNANAGSLLWTDLNSNLSTIQFIGIALHPTNNNIVFGGTQDNGTSQFQGDTAWTLREGGDGGDTAFGSDSTSRVYHIAPVASFGSSGFFRRSDNGGVTWSSKVAGINPSDPTNFYPPFVVDPVPLGGNDRLLLGTNRVYESTNNGDSWTPISTTGSGGWTSTSPIDDLATANTDVNTIYATAAGRLFVSTNRGASWTQRDIPGATDHVQDIEVDPTDRLVAYAVRDGFGGGKIFRTIDGGANWTNISSNLPDVPAYAIQIAPNGPGSVDDVLYLGNDSGVYFSTNLGASWARMGSGMPNVQVRDLELNQNHVLAAGTHGRGAWEILATAPAVVSGQVFNDLNGNGSPDAGEAGLAGWTAYIDQNLNGRLDSSSVNPASTDVPKAIPDLGTVTSNLPVAGLSGTVSDVNVTLNINHTFDSDLSVTLISPTGIRVELFTSVGGGGDNFTNTTLDDGAATSISAGSAPFNGTFRPVGSLAALNGQSPNGTWKLEIVDTAGQDVGTLNGWSLSIASAEPTTATSAGGNYSFIGLAPGNYRIRELPKPRWRQTAPAGGFYSVDVVAGNTYAGLDFGNLADSTPPQVVGGTFAFAPSQAVALTFSEDVTASLDPADLSVVNLATGVRVPGSEFTLARQDGAGGATTATWTHTGPLPDGNYRATLSAGSVADAAGNPSAADYALDFFVLAGDANRDRVVNFADLLALAKNYNGANKTWAEGDFTGDGTVNFADLLILAKAYNKSLAAPAPAPVPVLSAAAAASSGTPVPGVLKDEQSSTVFSTRRVTPPSPKPATVKPKPKAVARPGGH